MRRRAEDLNCLTRCEAAGESRRLFFDEGRLTKSLEVGHRQLLVRTNGNDAGGTSDRHLKLYSQVG